MAAANDPTARNLAEQLDAAEIERADVAVWNAVPWYLGNQRVIRGPLPADVATGTKHLVELVGLLPQLECAVLIGLHARKAHVQLSMSTHARILGCHHPAQQVASRNLAAAPENVAVFKRRHGDPGKVEISAWS